MVFQPECRALCLDQLQMSREAIYCHWRSLLVPLEHDPFSTALVTCQTNMRGSLQNKNIFGLRLSARNAWHRYIPARPPAPLPASEPPDPRALAERRRSPEHPGNAAMAMSRQEGTERLQNVSGQDAISTAALAVLEHLTRLRKLGHPAVGSEYKPARRCGGYCSIVHLRGALVAT